MKNIDLPVPTTVMPLPDPAQLGAAATAAVREILTEAASANTERSYASALRYWALWFQSRFGVALALPVAEATVMQFLVDHLARRDDAGVRTWELPPSLDALFVAERIKQRLGPLSLASVSHRLAVLSSVHRLKGVPNPCEAPAVRHLLARARRGAIKRGERPRKKTALTRADLRVVLATCDASLEGVRDRALLLFAFATGGRRRSEVAGADLADLAETPEGEYSYRLRHSKTQQAGPTASSLPEKPLVGTAAVAMRAWLAASGLTEGAIFRRLWRTRVGPALSPAAVGAIVQRRTALAGLVGDFGGHSVRSGFVTEGSRQGIALAALMAMTDHRSVASVIGYYHAGTHAQNPAARLLDDVAL